MWSARRGGGGIGRGGGAPSVLEVHPEVGTLADTDGLAVLDELAAGVVRLRERDRQEEETLALRSLADRFTTLCAAHPAAIYAIRTPLAPSSSGTVWGEVPHDREKVVLSAIRPPAIVVHPPSTQFPCRVIRHPPVRILPNGSHPAGSLLCAQAVVRRLRSR